jgi:hypothetical protein
MPIVGAVCTVISAPGMTEKHLPKILRDCQAQDRQCINKIMHVQKQELSSIVLL